MAQHSAATETFNTESLTIAEQAERYRACIARAPVAIMVVDATGRYVEVSPATCRISGYDASELLVMSLTDLLAEESWEAGREHFARVKQVGHASGEICWIHKDGTKRWSTCDAVKLSEDRFIAYLFEVTDRKRAEEALRASEERFRTTVEVEDITERKLREQEIERLSHLYAALSELNRIIVRVSTREELFREVCRIATEKAGFRMAWVGWHDRESQHVAPVARAGAGQDYLDEIKVYGDHRPEGLGPIGTCLREARVIVVHDLFTDARMAPWYRAAAQRGFRTVASLPIRYRGAVRGVLTAYDDEPNVLQDKEIALLEEAAAAISFALDRLEQETQRRESEEALRESRCFVQSTMDSLAAHVCVLDASGTIMAVNQSWRDFASANGLQQGNVCEGANYLAVCNAAEDADAEIARAFAEGIRAVLTGQRSSFELEYPCHSPGEQRWFAGRVTRFSGSAAAAVVAHENITERKRAEESLQLAKVAAEAASRAKSEFLANMSHELRTPMTAIMGFADILTLSPDSSPAERQEFLEGIQRNSQSLLRLIDDILDLSRIEADRLPVEKIDCPFREVVDDVLSAVQIQAQRKGLRLGVDYELPLLKTIHTDPARLRQILLNLVGNAIKFTELGEVRLSVRYLREGDGPGRMQFAVRDTGIGIPVDKLNDIFQPFVQVDGSLTRRFGGTGLGLGISQRLAKALGGNIAVSSRLGQGSTFTLTLDAGAVTTLSVAESQRIKTRRPEPASALQAGTFRGRVLFAEDFSDVQHLIRFHLSRMGLEVDIADNGRRACEMVEQSRAEGRPYDLLLIDIQMPVMDGYEATRWLREHGWRGPVVALTAFAMVGDRQKCLAAGCDDYLAKPITLQGLHDVVARYISAPADRPSAAAR